MKIIQPDQKEIEKDQLFYNSLRLAFWICLVLALGFLAVNQTLEFFYKAHFLKAPCDLCVELNPEVKQCLDYLNAPRASYWTPEGWTDPFKAPDININIPLI